MIWSSLGGKLHYPQAIDKDSYSYILALHVEND